MIFPNNFQKLASICLQMTLVFSTNMRMLIKHPVCQWFIDSKPSVHFGEDKA